MSEGRVPPPITLITGPRKSGRTTYAVLISSRLFFKEGIPCFHNGTVLFGRNIEEYADAHDGLLTLAERIPERSTILIEEADAKRATRQTGDPNHQASINSALAILAKKSCYLVLTTVQGNESLISEALVKRAYEHVTPLMHASRKETVALGTLHRLGRYMVPVLNMDHDPELVLNAMIRADTFRVMREGALGGKDVEYTEDRFVEVPQTSIDQMKHPKHPEYPVYYRQRTLRSLPNGSVHRLTEDAILHFRWLESVNEHPNETVMLEMLRRTMPQWGFDYHPRPTAQDTNFPDGQALIGEELANLEVVSIQPLYPYGGNLHDLVSLTQVGKAERILDGVVLQCKTCRTTETTKDTTWQNLPTHDEGHRWVMYLPGSLYSPDFAFDLAATPLLTISQQDFTNELTKAIQRKSKIIAEQGKGLRNWVIVLAQGFPIDANWYHELPDEWPDNVDGICVVATEGYIGAYNHLVPFNDFTALLLKCPPDYRDHNCYHPGYRYRIGGMDTDFRLLSRDSHTIEEVSAAAWNYPLPVSPVKKTLVVRDQQERELLAFRGALLTETQVREMLDESGYNWRERSARSFLLCSEADGPNQNGIWTWLRYVKSNEWIGSVFHEGYELKEKFITTEEAKRWCERHTAMLLLHIRG